jgi:hypothetical protein
VGWASRACAQEVIVGDRRSCRLVIVGDVILPEEVVIAHGWTLTGAIGDGRLLEIEERRVWGVTRARGRASRRPVGHQITSVRWQPADDVAAADVGM